jgi:histidinol-phosphate aminotransferase
MHLAGNCKPFIRQMRARGILVRDRSADFGCENCVRITLGTRDHNRQMLSALREVFTGLGLRQQVAR